MTSKACPLRHQGARLGQQPGNLAADELVAGGLLAVWVQPVRVADVPGANGGAVIVRHGLPGRGELGALGVKGVAVFVLCTPDGFVGRHCVDHENCVLGAVYVGIDPETEQMLMVVCVYA